MVPIPEGSETHSEESEFTAYSSQNSSHCQDKLDQPGELTGSGGCHKKALEERPPTVAGACELSG